MTTITLVNPADLVGAAEAVQITGMERGAFNMARVRGQTPEPIVTLACGPIWTRSQIEEWAAARAAKRLS